MDHVHVEVGPGPATGFLVALRRLTHAILAHLAARGELLAVEIAEEKERLFDTVIAAGTMLLTAVFAVVFAGVLLLVWAWDTDYRMTVAIALPVVFAVAAVGAFLWFRKLTSRSTALFKTSVQQLRRDVEHIRG